MIPADQGFEAGDLAGAHREALIDRYRLPRPRVACGILLRDVATAAIDVSDGLVADLRHVTEASGVAAVVEAAAVPLSNAAAAALECDPGVRDSILAGGDDYELLFTAPPEAASRLADIAAEIDVPITPIGRVEPGRHVRVLDAAGADIELAAGGYTHR